MIRRRSNSTALRETPSDNRRRRYPVAVVVVAGGTASGVGRLAGGSILLVLEEGGRRNPVGEIVSIGTRQADAARAVCKHSEVVYLLGVPAIALRRGRALVVVIVGGHCGSWSRSIADENAGCLAAVQQLGGEMSRSREA